MSIDEIPPLYAKISSVLGLKCGNNYLEIIINHL